MKLTGYIIYAERRDLPYVLLKKFNPEVEGPRFIRIHPDGTRTGHDTKRKDSPTITEQEE